MFHIWRRSRRFEDWHPGGDLGWMLLLEGKKRLLIGKMVGNSLLGHKYAADIRRDLFLYCLTGQSPPKSINGGIQGSSTFPNALPLLRWHSDLYISLTFLVQVGQVFQSRILLGDCGIRASNSSESGTAFVSTSCWLYGRLNGALTMVRDQSIARRSDRSGICENFNVRHAGGLKADSVYIL